jgi:hypothetical protein
MVHCRVVRFSYTRSVNMAKQQEGKKPKHLLIDPAAVAANSWVPVEHHTKSIQPSDPISIVFVPKWIWATRISLNILGIQGRFRPPISI